MSSRKGKGKTSTPQTRRPQSEIDAALRRVLRHLGDAADRFDSGDRDEAITLSVLLRNLLYYGSSPPLLHHAGLIKKLDFINTGPHHEADISGMVAGGLVMWEARTTATGSSTGRVRAKLDMTDVQPRRKYTPWWKNDLVILDQVGKWKTRQFIVKTMANSDGAHFDPFVDGDYYELASDNGGWSTTGSDGLEMPFEGDIASASVRQIAWEVLQTVLPAISHGSASGTQTGTQTPTTTNGY